MPRRNFPAKVKLAAFERSGGMCEECGAKLFSGRWECDHIVTDHLGGGNDLANARALCRDCHAKKTGADAKAHAKVRSVRARHLGAKAPKKPMPGGRKSPWKRRLDGTVVRRDK